MPSKTAPIVDQPRWLAWKVAPSQGITSPSIQRYLGVPATAIASSSRTRSGAVRCGLCGVAAQGDTTPGAPLESAAPRARRAPRAEGAPLAGTG
jgi:hypothetical protein